MLKFRVGPARRGLHWTYRRSQVRLDTAYMHRRRIFVEHSAQRIGQHENTFKIVCRLLPQEQRPRLLSQLPTFAATLSDVGVCIASLTSPNVPSPIVLLSTNCPTCISLPLGIGNVGGKLPDHFRRFAMALSPRADPLRLGPGCGVCAISSPSHAVLHRPSHVSCIRYAHETEHLKLSPAIPVCIIVPRFDHGVCVKCVVSSSSVRLFIMAVSENSLNLQSLRVPLQLHFYDIGVWFGEGAHWLPSVYHTRLLRILDDGSCFRDTHPAGSRARPGVDAEESSRR